MKRQVYLALDNSIGDRFVVDIEGKAQIRDKIYWIHSTGGHGHCNNFRFNNQPSTKIWPRL